MVILENYEVATMLDPVIQHIVNDTMGVLQMRNELVRINMENEALEWERSFAYSLGYEDAQHGKDKDPDFDLDLMG